MTALRRFPLDAELRSARYTGSPSVPGSGASGLRRRLHRRPFRPARLRRPFLRPPRRSRADDASGDAAFDAARDDLRAFTRHRRACIRGARFEAPSRRCRASSSAPGRFSVGPSGVRPWGSSLGISTGCGERRRRHVRGISTGFARSSARGWSLSGVRALRRSDAAEPRVGAMKASILCSACCEPACGGAACACAQTRDRFRASVYYADPPPRRVEDEQSVNARLRGMPPLRFASSLDSTQFCSQIHDDLYLQGSTTISVSDAPHVTAASHPRRRLASPITSGMARAEAADRRLLSGRSRMATTNGLSLDEPLWRGDKAYRAFAASTLRYSESRDEVVFSAKRDGSFDVGLVALDGSRSTGCRPIRRTRSRCSGRRAETRSVTSCAASGGDVVRTVHIPTSFAVRRRLSGRARSTRWPGSRRRSGSRSRTRRSTPPNASEVMHYGGAERRMTRPAGGDARRRTSSRSRADAFAAAPARPALRREAAGGGLGRRRLRLERRPRGADAERPRGGRRHDAHAGRGVLERAKRRRGSTARAYVVGQAGAFGPVAGRDRPSSPTRRRSGRPLPAAGDVVAVAPAAIQSFAAGFIADQLKRTTPTEWQQPMRREEIDDPRVLRSAADRDHLRQFRPHLRLPGLQDPHGSMEDNLKVGDHIIVNKFIYGPQADGPLAGSCRCATSARGDIIVFRYPEQPETDFVKRVDRAARRDDRRSATSRSTSTARPLDEPYVVHDDPTDLSRAAGAARAVPLARPLRPVSRCRRGSTSRWATTATARTTRATGDVPRVDDQGRAFMVYWSFDGEPPPPGSPPRAHARARRRRRALLHQDPLASDVLHRRQQVPLHARSESPDGNE